MAVVQITIPDEHAQRVLDAFAGAYAWAPESGVTKADFAKARVIRYMKDVVHGYEEQVARQAAEASVTPAPDLT